LNPRYRDKKDEGRPKKRKSESSERRHHEKKHDKSYDRPEKSRHKSHDKSHEKSPNSMHTKTKGENKRRRSRSKSRNGKNADKNDRLIQVKEILNQNKENKSKEINFSIMGIPINADKEIIHSIFKTMGIKIDDPFDLIKKCKIS